MLMQQWSAWYKTKLYIYIIIYWFQKHVHYESNDNVIKYYGSLIPHNWDMSFETFGELPTVVAFWEN